MFTNTKNQLLKKPRSVKRILLIVLDSIMLPLVLWSSISITQEKLFKPEQYAWVILFLAIFITIPIFIRFGLYRSVIKHFRSQALISIFFATILSAVTLISADRLLSIGIITVSSVLFYWLSIFTLIAVTRISAQHWLYGDYAKKTLAKNTLIYGAGTAGSQLATVLKTDDSFRLRGFIDDDKSLTGWNILGLKVYSPNDLENIIKNFSIQEVILAIPSADRATRKVVLKRLETLPVYVRSIPALSELMNGKMKSTDIKDIDIDDLLGRDVIEPDSSLLPANIKDKVVMVTGAGGSIGSELCRQIIQLSPKKLLLLEQSEFALYQIEQELEEIINKNNLDVKVNRILGSITNPVLLQRLFNNKSIQTIYHAAAYKHVPLVEENPVAGLSNNVFGTRLLAEYALEANVETFILISTDKAVRPTNVMGCSKRIAEMVLQALSEKPDCTTTFTMVRFGNVLGSSGSVVPKFRKQILAGGPITVTHQDITRFFMSIPEAVQLVIQAGAMAKGGDVFVLDMGKSVKISDLAVKMIHLSGYKLKDEDNPDGDISVEYTGLRPGEKLYEELLIGEDVSGTQHPRIMRANEIYIHWNELIVHLNNLQHAMMSLNVTEIKELLAKFVDGYKPWVKSQNKNIQTKDIENKLTSDIENKLTSDIENKIVNFR